MKLQRTARKWIDIPVRASLRDRRSVSLVTIDYTLTAPGVQPTLATQWITVPVVDDIVSLLITGPEAATTTNSIVIPTGGADLWLRVADNSELDPVLIDRITIA